MKPWQIDNGLWPAIITSNDNTAMICEVHANNGRGVQVESAPDVEEATRNAKIISLSPVMSKLIKSGALLPSKHITLEQSEAYIDVLAELAN